MVRRVTTGRAHVFIATKMACSAQLVLYTGRQSHKAPTDSSGRLATGEEVALDPIGENLFLGVIPVDIPSPVAAGTLLSYDVILVDDDGGPARGLYALGMLGGPKVPEMAEDYDPRRAAFPLGYEDGMLPSFVVPPDALSEIRIAHASCRKPHGGGDREADALQLLDAAIRSAVLKPSVAEPRPQQLILTGDQVYADDVAPGLLKALSGAGDALLGWTESLPVVGVDATRAAFIQPGWRTRFLSIPGVDLKEIPDEDATDYSQSHLLRFGEWVAMYLFAWSDALWPLDDRGEYDLPGPPSNIPVDKILSAAGLILDIGEKVGLVAPPARLMTALEVGEKIASALTEHAKKVEDIWDETRPKVLRYARSTPSIRRALANCATYTMFDDHEITDDWNVTKRVHDRLKGDGTTRPGKEERAEVGPRILRNGLSAYAFFQHWGNAPEAFGDGPAGKHGRDLLRMWRYEAGSCEMKSAPRGGDALLGIASGDSPVPTASEPYPRMRWDYAVGFPAHRLIALDTRTWRSFPPGTPFSWSDLAPLGRNGGGDPSQGGAPALTDIAATWKRAGQDGGSIVARHFGLLIDDYVALASTAADDLEELRAKTALFLEHFSVFLRGLPWRVDALAGELADPVDSLVQEIIDNPDAIATRLAEIARDEEEFRRFVDETLDLIPEFDLGPAPDPNMVFEALGDFVEAAWAGSIVGMVHASKRAANRAVADLWGLFTSSPLTDSVRDALVLGLQGAVAVLEDLADETGLEDLGRAVFRDGSNRLAPGLIRQDILPFMVGEPLATVSPAAPITVLLSPAPVFGHRLIELLQRLSVVRSTLDGIAGEEELDFEPWTANVPAMIDLFEAAHTLDGAIILSGDVHYAGSSVVRVRTADAETRYLQFTSSSARNSDSMTQGLAHLDDLLYDQQGTSVFQQADALSLLRHVEAAGAHAELIARVKGQQVYDDFVASVREYYPSEVYDDLVDWWNNSPPLSWQSVGNMVDQAVDATEETARTMVNEVAWQILASVEGVLEFGDDPVLAMFGDFLSAPAPLKHHLRDFYQQIGLDPSNGLHVTQTVLVDQRSPRLPLYPANIHATTGELDPELVEATNRRTVGHANVGFISFHAPRGALQEVRHELRWYPTRMAEPSGGSASDNAWEWGAIPRTDWYGTLHRAGWVGSVANPSGNPP